MRKYSNNRSSKMADQIQKDIVNILRVKINDPRISWVTINEVEVTNDYSWAKVYWTLWDNEKKLEVENVLNKATGFIRSELSKCFHTYTIPQLKFIFDESLERGTKILSIINKVSQEFSDENDDETNVNSNSNENN